MTACTAALELACLAAAACSSRPAPAPLEGHAASSQLTFACLTMHDGWRLCTTAEACPKFRDKLASVLSGSDQELGPCERVEHVWCRQPGMERPCFPSAETCDGARERASEVCEMR